jgi:hypothetical protein
LAHYRTARYHDDWNVWLGGLLIVTSIVAAVLAGRTLFSIDEATTNTLALVASAFTVSLASLQVFRGDASRADGHRRTAAAYSAIKRDIEQMFTNTEGAPANACALEMLKLRLKVVAEESLGVPGRIWRRVDREAPSRSGDL